MNIKPILFIICLAAASCGKNADEYDASGNFEADEIIVSSEATGKILKLDLTEGAELKKGQVVGYIDTIQLSLRKKQLAYSVQATLARRPDAASQLATIQKQIDTNEFEKKRVENLLKDDAATKKQLDDLNAQIEILRKQYNSLQTSLSITTRALQSETLPLQAQIEQLQDQIKKSVIVNPIDGTVLEQYAEQDEVVTMGKAIYKIADLSHIILRVYISGDQLSSVKLGQKIKVTVDDVNGGSKNYEGVVEWVSDKAEFTPKTIQTKDERANLVYAVKVRVQNDGYLKLGMYADVNLK
ncbi:MAG TPA: HlyD family efflux transporter periplasmic adaptor subunit [Cyclobacteriaceae bacterium]|nr:HlyD family efflux transporter periplasmic adaptor subunit [Cyclobacteriaceae bacterium]